MVEKEREKVLRIVVTGGGEGTEAENTEKANHRGHGGHGEKQTTENTEKNKPRRTRRTRRWEERGRTRWSAPTWLSIGVCRGRWVEGPKAGWKAGRRLESLPHIGHDMEGTEDTEKNKPRRTRRTR